MHTDHDDLLLKIAGDIADGKTVNWDELTDQFDDATLACLKDIAAIATQFSAVGHVVDDGLKQLRAQPVTALWAHLEVLDEIGRGSSGVVYRAFDPMLNRAVALKVRNPENGHADDLLREARQMAKVDHPGVLKIHGAQCVDGQVGFWSDLVEGESIATRLERESRVAAAEVVTVGLEICVALAAIHRCDLVHGDVKAQNVVRDRDGRHVLIDFGSARNSFDCGGMSGTPSYLAPERLVDGATTQVDDLYSLGVLLFRMLSGRFPVEGSSLADLEQAHRDGRRAHLVDLVPNIDPRLSALVERAIDRVPEWRFRSAGEFASALNAVLPGAREPAASAHTVAPAPTTAASRFKPIAVACAGAVALALASVAWNPASPPMPIEFQARMLKANGGVEYPLLDGDRIGVGDALSMDIDLTRAAHVYVLNEDATGAVYQLFPLPMTEWINPLPPGQRIRLPGRIAGGTHDWTVTSPGARERFYVLVSAQPIAELQVASTGFAQAEVGRPLDRTALIAAARVTRGVGGLNARTDPAAHARFEVGAWLDAMRAQKPDLGLQRFELDNP